MPAARQLVFKGRIIQGSAVILTARIRNAETGVPLTPDDVSSLVVKVFDTRADSRFANGGLVIPDGEGDGYDGTTFAPADVFLDALDTGPLSPDRTGINLRINLNGSYFPDGDDRVYRVQARLTPAEGDPFTCGIWELQVVPVYPR